MTEQIYINDVLMDRTSGKAVSLVFQSTLFADIDSIVSNRTNSVEFPATRKNLAAVGNPHVAGSKSVFAYRKHRVLYFRDGVQIFSGYATLLSVSGSSIKFSFTWGNVSIFNKMLEYKLRDIASLFNDGDAHLPWDDDSVVINPSFPYNVDTGGYRHPAVSVSGLLSEIQMITGVMFENKERLTNYSIPVLGNKADDFAKRMQGVILRGNLYTEQRQYRYWHCLAVGAEDSDVRGLYRGNGMYYVGDFSTVKIEIEGGFEYSMSKHSGGSEQTIRVYAIDGNGIINTQLTYFKLYKDTEQSRYVYRTNITIPVEKKEVVLTVENYEYIKIVICEVGTAQTSTKPVVASAYINIIPDYDQEQELIYGGSYPLFSNLPDWTISQMLKNLMKMEGLFAVCPDDKTIRFVSIDDLFDARRNALDITDKLIFKDGAPDDRTYTFNQYARKNYFRYSEDETVKTNADGVIEIDDDNLDAEKDVLKLDFAASDMSGDRVKIPLYTKGDDGNIEYNDVTPRILKKIGENSYKQEKLTFEGLDWDSLVNVKYLGFKRCISRAKVVKASMRIDTVSLSKLDLSVPVYSYALGHYYAILKLTTKDNGLADVELLQLNEKIGDEDKDMLNPYLIVTSRVDGNYYATLSNKTSKEILAYKSDENYKICLIRYGYARRGKFFNYVDKLGHDTNSHTDRRANKNAVGPGWRNVRKKKGEGTLRWRIIGDELLRTGKIASHSQTAKHYAGVSLVFDLEEVITLPAIPKRAKTESGRIGNKASDGLAELSIAMFHNDGKGNWTIVSNICPIRSRTDDKTMYWDFEPTNVKNI